MTGNTDNARVWALADIYVAPLDTAGPSDLDPFAELDAAFDAVGLIGEDGIVGTTDEDENTHYALGGILVRVTHSKHRETIKFTVLEDNDVTFELANPGSESSTAGGVVSRVVKVPQRVKQSFVIESTDGDTMRRRYYPTAEITEVGDEMIAKDDELSGRELTMSVYPDGDGVKYYEWTEVAPGS